MFERKFFPSHAPFWLIASDEAGRGPLAGPVVAGAVALRVESHEACLKLLRRLRRWGVDDSKALSGEERQQLLTKLQWVPGSPQGSRQLLSEGLLGAWAQIGPAEIDEINILQASLKAMRLAAEAVSALENLPVVWLIDGNRAPREAKVEWQVHTVIDGDAKSVLIGLASLIAKETRDHFMREFDQRYPGYGFSQHAGYATASHREAILRHGITPIHRKSFGTVKTLLQGTEARA